MDIPVKMTEQELSNMILYPKIKRGIIFSYSNKYF